ncbi:MAG: hypothetical protein HZA66_24830 [Rhodopseudomonas palustris]|uniref:Uncharacterized protein n=1 Tax=Rhodopseudomonas palustris TaxID=1076 RepID=A0A933S534_RHOPL|nr:hypothetical protein [Rhodopseudomonas palustris]
MTTAEHFAELGDVTTIEAEFRHDVGLELEDFPVPHGSDIRAVTPSNSQSLRPQFDRRPAKYPVHPDLWRAISSTPYGREAIARLEEALSPEAPDREKEAARLHEVAGVDTPIADLIEAILGRASNPKHTSAEKFPDEIPGPRSWTPWQLLRARYDASTICISKQWNLPTKSNGNVVRPSNSCFNSPGQKG